MKTFDQKKSYAVSRMALASDRLIFAVSLQEKCRAAKWVAAWGKFAAQRQNRNVERLCAIYDRTFSPKNMARTGTSGHV